MLFYNFRTVNFTFIKIENLPKIVWGGGVGGWGLEGGGGGGERAPLNRLLAWTDNVVGDVNRVVHEHRGHYCGAVKVCDMLTYYMVHVTRHGDTYIQGETH